MPYRLRYAARLVDREEKTKYQRLRPDFTSKLVHVLAFGTPKFYIAPDDKIKHELVNLNSKCDVKSSLRPDFTSKLEHGLAFGTPKFYIAPYDKINHALVNLSYNCDVKSGLKVQCFVGTIKK